MFQKKINNTHLLFQKEKFMLKKSIEVKNWNSRLKLTKALKYLQKHIDYKNLQPSVQFISVITK
jgi:hypothetical protein